VKECLQEGTDVIVEEYVPSLLPMYRISTYRYDGAPFKISEVQPNSPASDEGLQAGDFIKELDGFVPSSTDEFIKYVNKNLGNKILLSIIRHDQEFEVEISTRINPPEGQGPIGIKFWKIESEGEGGYMLTWSLICFD
jgi:S1-C subfamily serine protease